MHMPPGSTTSHTIQCCGSQLRYFVFNGNKPQTIVMLHGFSGNHRGLLPFINELPEYRIIVPDLPGFGFSSPMTRYPHTIAGYARCMHTLITQLDLQRPTLLGHSFGTVVAARIAAQWPDLISDTLVMVSPASVSPLVGFSLRRVAAHAGQAHYWLGTSLPGKRGDAWVKSPLISKLSSYALITTKEPSLRRAIYTHHLSDLDFLVHKDVFYQAYRSLNHEGVINYAPRIAQRVLLIAGTKDAMWPPKTQQALAQALSHATLILLPNAGHLTHFEAPKEIGARIRAFLTPQL